ncbi:GAF and ANTAR domain-containing protein [Actinomycetospora cinnamomea]|uniref:ANTAR domain-containing protein n=1 Tax=Actinomycetospora cinnamomea TaxID=663609 RepID=A0A2U1EBK4_9PSEU|nr:GAF and ANTAR domain-containing protein [Actinomycetospora cinnamomea]PVY97262.1 ANTAR domain-containing protein [Actinomycetospora cinnamomea]
MDRRTLPDREILLGGIVKAAVDTVPGADAGGISVLDAGRVDTRAPIGAGVTTLDRLQSELQEGPCITAIDEPGDDGVVLAEDLSDGDGRRWPRFAPAAVEQGYRAIMGVQLSPEPEAGAALNLYGAEPRAFDARARMTAGLFGVQAGALLYGAEQARKVLDTVDDREVVARAQGMLCERHDVSGDEAFDMLVTSAQRTGIGLVDIASWIVGDADGRRSPRDRPADD